MNRAVSPSNGRMTPSSPLAVSKSRSEVEPAATIRPPARRTRFSASAVCAVTLPCSACMRCAAVSAALTGRNVPAPTCSVTLWSVIPSAVSRDVNASVKCNPAVGAATDVGRQRHGAALVDRLVENGPVKGEGERDLAALVLGFDGGVELAEETDFALVPEAHHVARRQPL